MLLDMVEQHKVVIKICVTLIIGVKQKNGRRTFHSTVAHETEPYIE
jgi:hypothetical protein